MVGQPITVFGDGNQTRDFIYITMLSAIADALERSGFADGPVNVGTGLGQLHDIVALKVLTGKDINVHYERARLAISSFMC